MSTKRYFEYVADRDNQKPVVQADLREYREWLYGELSALAVRGDRPPAELVKAIAREAIERELVLAGLANRIPTLAALECQNLDRFLATLEGLSGSRHYAVCHQAFFDAFDQHVVEPDDVDRLTEQACDLLKNKVLKYGLTLAAEMEAKGARGPRVDVSPILGDWLPENFVVRGGICEKILESSGQGNNRVANRTHAKVFLVFPRENRANIEIKVRDVALGIKTHLEKDTLLEKGMPETSKKFDVWALRLEAADLMDLGNCLVTERATPIMSIKRLIQ
jgi:hypothetical protein